MNRETRRTVARRPERDTAPVEDVSAASAASAASAGEVAAERDRGVTPAGGPGRRTNPRQFLHEVNIEMRKVVWPTRAETANYSTVVFFTLAILMALIFGLDIGFSKIAVFLFK